LELVVVVLLFISYLFVSCLLDDTKNLLNNGYPGYVKERKVFAEESFAVGWTAKCLCFCGKVFAVSSFESILRLTIFKRYFSKLFRRFLQIKGVIITF